MSTRKASHVYRETAYYTITAWKRLITLFSSPSVIVRVFLFLCEYTFKFGGGNFSCKNENPHHELIFHIVRPAWVWLKIINSTCISCFQLKVSAISNERGCDVCKVHHTLRSTFVRSLNTVLNSGSLRIVLHFPTPC